MRVDTPDSLVMQDGWSDLRQIRALPEIDQDRLYRYRTERLRDQMRQADVAAMVTVREPGTFSRFENPKKLIPFLGPIPSKPW